MLKAEQILQGRYQLKQQLGQNAGRQTWLAEDLTTQPKQQVVVKLLAFSPQMEWDELKLFEREAQVLKNIEHPRIPRYRDYFYIEKEEDLGLPLFGLVQDYIPGHSLGEILAEGQKFTESQAQKFATDILNILMYLHELSPLILHRDIKPSNIILGKYGKFYLVDFGAVQDRAKAEGVTFTVVGTSGYAPPEQLWGKAVSASDLYALGATLIHLLTGTAPADLQQQMRLEFRDKVRLNPSFTQWIETLVEPATEKRFESAREAIKALKKPVSQPVDRIKKDANKRVNYARLLCLSFMPLGVLSLIAVVALPSLLSSFDRAEQTEAEQKNLDINERQKF